MKVILLHDVENLGKKFEVKEVKAGYARNFLIPNKMAELATKKKLKWIDDQREIIEKQAEEDLKKAQDLASKLDGTELAVLVKVGDAGQLFESVSAQKIAEKLSEAGFDIKKPQILINEPIKELGEFPIKINLDHNLEVEINLTISPEKSGLKKEEDL